MTRVVAGFLLACGLAHAGTITGSVIEEASGRPLARTIVRLQPIRDSTSTDQPHPLVQTRATASGSFTFAVVPPGWYLIIATREYYFPASYGQRRPDGQGVAVEVTNDSSLFAQLRMRRMGVVTGRVLDENDIGMPNVTVVAYRARFPLRVLGRGVSDDRGAYRIFNLDPGKYWVRTTSKALDDGAQRLPTFGRESLETRDALPQEVHVDQETAYADLRPMPGRLFRLSGSVVCPESATATVTLSSEVERRTITIGCSASFQFEGLAPGLYEVFAEVPQFESAGFVERHLDRDTSLIVNTGRMPRVDVEVPGLSGGLNRTPPIVITGHRQDLADGGPDRPIALHGPLAPGHWLITARAGPTQYVESITGSALVRERRLAQPPDAFDVLIDGISSRIVVRVSDRAATIEGLATWTDGKPVPGAPAFLWAESETARRSVGSANQTLTDSVGHYQFTGLPPGDYRVLATYDIREVDADILDAARITPTRIDAGEKKTLNLSLWIAP